MQIHSRHRPRAIGSFDLYTGLRRDPRIVEDGAQLCAVMQSYVRAQQDTLYLALVSETGWPYVQHRGGPRGFLKILEDQTLAFADYRGNRQYISTGNFKANDRACTILVDYPRRGETGTDIQIAARGIRLELPAAHYPSLH
ncbi:pyridoxamine 5'-phosphate oxidase family protein [Rugamonas sp. A1-17]|nr:pyridoxamine 5'-phosphate oxidase family protein [Rugamonas sp. A1-17]